MVVGQLKSLECVSLEELGCQNKSCQPTIANVAGAQGDGGELAVLEEDLSEDVDVHTTGATKLKTNETKALQMIAPREPVENASLERVLAMASNHVQVSDVDIALQGVPESTRGSQVRQVLAVSKGHGRQLSGSPEGTAELVHVVRFAWQKQPTVAFMKVVGCAMKIESGPADKQMSQ